MSASSFKILAISTQNIESTATPPPTTPTPMSRFYLITLQTVQAAACTAGCAQTNQTTDQTDQTTDQTDQTTDQTDQTMDQTDQTMVQTDQTMVQTDQTMEKTD